FFSSRRRHTRFSRDWSSDVCSSDLHLFVHPADSADAPARGCGVTAFAGAAPASGCGPSRAAAHPVPDASLRASSASHRRHAYNRASALYAEADNALQRSEEHTSELQSRENLVCRLLLEKKKT